MRHVAIASADSEPEIREIKVGFGGGLSIQDAKARHRARQRSLQTSVLRVLGSSPEVKPPKTFPL
jgi:hypothetical protein